jgi:hypothetical protein
MLKKLCLSLLFFVIALPALAATVSLSTLLDEMIDRDALTRFPDPAYVCVQASSYDRASKSPNEPGWFANADASQFIREEMNGNRKEWVLMDAEGPGAIVRWWITAPHYKVIFRVYLDGSDTPTLEANIADLIGGKFLVDAPLSAERARGRNLYLPIPYAKQCKVTVDDMPTQNNLYYQINYRTYAKGTEVETFKMDNFKSLKNKIDAVQKTLLAAGADVASHLGSASPTNVLIKKGETMSLSGKMLIPNSVLQRIILKIDARGEELAQALRSTVISIKFDDKETVWCPLGDFFGSGVGVNPYKSWYARVERDGTLISLWRMPCQKSAEVSLINYGERGVRVVQNAFSTDSYKWDSRSMYFHADWRQQRNMETVPPRDWNYTKIKGHGVFVGDVLSVLNRHPAWWGEGDEKIYVDGETFPSHFGTGTEDYYGYAWCTPQFFEAPFHFQPRAEGPRNYGNVTNGRVRLLDGIPFTKDFRFDMEVLHHQKAIVDYAVATFWYAFDGASLVDFPSRQEQIAEVKSPVLYKTPVSLDIPGFKIEKAPTGGAVQQQGMRNWSGGKWHNDDQLWWTGAKPNDKLELILETDKEGTYKLIAELTKARDYGIIQFSVDGTKVGGPIDLYNPDVIPTGAIEVGTVNLKPGKHVVQVEILGKNEKAEPSYMVGIDQLKLLLP